MAIKALFTSATGMNAQSFALDTTANNLANINTTGFKRNQADFQDLIYVSRVTPGSQAAQGQQVPTGVQVGSGVRISGTSKIFDEGSLVNTNNPLDVAIEGQGFLQIILPNGERRYTRDGALALNTNGNLVNQDGFLVDPQITIPQDAVSISVGADGTVSVINAGAANASVSLGQLTLVRFPNPAGLSAEGRNLFSETASSGAPIIATPGQSGTGLLRQGFLERSNVDAVTELINLIVAQRAFEFNSRAVRAADEVLSNTTNLTQ
jgi:flagellar basal-body rod protein FlgG